HAVKPPIYMSIFVTLWVELDIGKEGERFGNCYKCLGWERVGIVVVNQRRDVVLPAYENLYKDSAEKHDTPLSGHSSDIKFIDDKRAFLKQLEPQKKVKCLRFSIHT
ncbi:hypothetical protein Tco_1510764, partial [Tanacetum coccineum]